jgi:hypothetical protein
MKYCLEFGMRGRYLSSQIVVPTGKLARRLASNLVHVLHPPLEGVVGCHDSDWELSAQYPRRVWISTTHYVALSLLDGVDRGPASARYWNVPEEYHIPRLEKWAKDGERPV